MSPRDAVIGVVIPLAVSLAVMLIVRQSWAGPLALAAGFCGIMPTILGRFPRPWPAVSPDWLFYIAIFVAFVGLAELWLKPGYGLRALAVMIAFAAVFSSMLLIRRLRDPDFQTEAAIWLPIGFAVAAAWWFAFDHAGDRGESGWVAPVAMLVLTAFAAVVLGMSHSFDYGRIGMGLAAAFAPIPFLGAWSQRYFKGASVVAIVGILLPLLVVGKLFADLTVLSFMLIAAAPVLFWLGWRLLPQRWSRNSRGYICLSLLILPLGSAILIILPAFLQAVRETTGGYGY